MKNRKTQEMVPFWVPRDEGSGITVVRVPGSTYIKPAFGKYRHIEKWGSYATNDPRFGENSVVYITYDDVRETNVKEIIIGLPPDIVAAATEYDRKDLNLQRKNEEHHDLRSQDSGRDEDGDYHLGGIDQAAYESFLRGDPEQDLLKQIGEDTTDPDEEYLKQFSDAQLLGDWSDDIRVRQAQVIYLCKVIRKEVIPHLPDKNLRVYWDLFGNSMKEVDIADELGCGKTAISNHKKRILNATSGIISALGYPAPSKAQLKKEKEASDAHAAVFEQEESECRRQEREEAREIRLLRMTAKALYDSGSIDEAALMQIEEDLDEAA